MEVMIWIWLAVIVLSIVCEGATTALISIWFVPGAVLGMIFAALSVAVWVQVLVFFVLSAVLVVMFQLFFKKRLSSDKTKATNLDLIVGSKAVVIERIDNVKGDGCVKIDGKYWSARSDDDEIIEDGATVEIIAVSGVKLICRKI